MTSYLQWHLLHRVVLSFSLSHRGTRWLDGIRPKLAIYNKSNFLNSIKIAKVGSNTTKISTILQFRHLGKKMSNPVTLLTPISPYMIT